MPDLVDCERLRCRINSMKKLLTLSTLLLLGTYGYDVSEAQGQSQLQKKHITRACSIVGSTPKFLSEQKFAEEIYKLEDLAGRDTYLDGYKLRDIYWVDIMAPLSIGSEKSFISSCEYQLKREFSNDFSK